MTKNDKIISHLGLLSLFQLLWEGSYIAVLNPFSPVSESSRCLSVADYLDSFFLIHNC